MKIEIIETGTVMGYQEYHADVYADNEKIAESHYDKRQRKHICTLNGKRIYRDNLSGIKIAVEKLLTSPLT